MNGIHTNLIGLYMFPEIWMKKEEVVFWQITLATRRKLMRDL